MDIKVQRYSVQIQIHHELLKFAREKPGKQIAYGALAKMVNIELVSGNKCALLKTPDGKIIGSWEDILDPISEEQRSRGLPDVTFLAINSSTNLPSKVDGVYITTDSSPEALANAALRSGKEWEWIKSEYE